MLMDGVAASVPNPHLMLCMYRALMLGSSILGPESSSVWLA